MKVAGRGIGPYVIVLLIALFLFYEVAGFDFVAPAGRPGPDIWPRLVLLLAALVCVYEIVRRLIVAPGAATQEAWTEPPVEAPGEDTEAPELSWRRMVPLDRSGPSAIHLGRPIRPDHLLASPALAARHRRSELINRDLPDDTDTGAPDSPHAPILAEFDLD